MNKNIGIIVDAGHGGDDPGAISNNIKEKDLTLEISKYIDKRLKDLGINSKMTREEDIYLPKDKRVKKVKELFNDSKDVILVSNHINAGGGEGAEVVYSLYDSPNLANMILDNLESSGQKSRGSYQRVLPENPTKDYYYIIRDTGNAESILIEYGFIDNKNDQNKLLNNINNYGEAVVKALANYIGVNYIKPNENNNKIYTVIKGDTLYSISKKFNISVDDIKRINNLNSNEIYVGQELILSPQTSEYYIVKRGDTLYGIANRFNINVNELKKINNLDSNQIYIGQELLIPNIETIIPDTNIDNNIYIVKKGDSLWSISRKYNIKVDELIKYNNLDNNTIYEGQQLLIPTDNKYYIVQKGDTIWQIAKNNNLTVSEIMRLNNLNDTLISIGQKLIIK